MSRVDWTDLERNEYPGDRLRQWFADIVAMAGLGAVGWFVGDALITHLSRGGWVALATAVASSIVIFLWFRWSAWSSRARLFCAVLIVLAILQAWRG